jgi:hypothetical protein
MAKKSTTQSNRSFIPANALGAVLANQYQPGSFGSIPNEAIGNLFNRMDKAYYEGQNSLSTMQEMLAKDVANASDDDRVYLQGMYDQVKNVITDASTKNDFHNRVRQVRDLARNITGNPNYMHIKKQMAMGEEQQTMYNKMVSELGAENVTFSGDYYKDGFSSIGPNGEMNRLNGVPTARPNYTTEMQKMFTPRLEVTQTRAGVRDFIEDEGYDMWIGTQAGRIHINDMARSMFEKPFLRLDPETQQPKVVEAVKNALKAAGESRVGKYNSGSNSTRLKDPRYAYLNDAGSPDVTGNYESIVTEGSDADDISIPTYFTNAPGDGLERTLVNMISGDANLEYIPMGSKFSTKQRTTVDEGQIVGAHLTPAINPINGEPIVRVTMNNSKAGDATQNSEQVGYISMSPADYATFANQSMDDFMLQQGMNNNNFESRKMAYPILSMMRDPYLGTWMKNIDEVDQYQFHDVPGLVLSTNDNRPTGVYVERILEGRDEGKYNLKSKIGRRNVRTILDGRQIPIQAMSESEMRNIIGKLYYTYATGQN